LNPLRRQLLDATLSRVFGGVDASTLAEIEAACEWLDLPSGQTLFRQGDPGESLYAIVSGRVVIRAERDGAEVLVREVGRGETIGEMALLTGDLRSATVVAIRDSVLVRLRRDAFDRLLESHPRMALGLSRLLVERLRAQTTAPPSALRTGSNIAIVSAGRGAPPAPAFAEELVRALEVIGSVAHLNRSRVDEQAGRAGAASAAGDVAEDWLASWLDEQEVKHTFVVYEADPDATDWSRRCLRQADVVVCVADATGDPELGAIEQEFGDGADAVRRVLVLVHPAQTEQPSGTAAWLAARRIASHHHVRSGSRSDTARVARVLSGTAIGLVLGGGAARGFAHVGAFRALCEAGVPIDWVGGASIGSAMGGLIALGRNPAEMQDTCRRVFVEENPLGDYTLPLISLVRGKRLARQLDEHFGLDIEDLWLPFFCVSTDVSDAGVLVQERGSLARAVRSSVALPGVLPPAVLRDHLLIDGGVLNNLPVDVMRTKSVGPIIAVDLHVQKDYTLDYEVVPSPWRLLWSRLMPFSKRVRVPGILTLMMKAMEVGTVLHTRSMRAHTDLWLNPPVGGFGILDMAAFDRIAELGYDHARKEIATWLESARGVRVPLDAPSGPANRSGPASAPREEG